MHEIWRTSAVLYPECIYLGCSLKFQSAVAPPSEDQLWVGRIHTNDEQKTTLQLVQFSPVIASLGDRIESAHVIRKSEET